MTFNEWKESRTYGLTEPIWDVARDAYIEALKHAATLACIQCWHGNAGPPIRRDRDTFFHGTDICCMASIYCMASYIHKEIEAMTE